jgi:hypothetical protein
MKVKRFLNIDVDQSRMDHDHGRVPYQPPMFSPKSFTRTSITKSITLLCELVGFYAPSIIQANGLRLVTETIALKPIVSRKYVLVE